MSADCNPIIDTFQREVGDLDVSDKYLQLMRDSVSDDSLYIRMKDTLVVLFNDLQLTETEKAKLAGEYMASMSVQLSSSSMQTALSWAKEERDGGYALAKLKADTGVSLANYEKTKEEICLVKVQVEKACADITATIAGSIRENGSVLTYDADGCKPLTIANEGLKYEQTQQVIAATYQVHADAYRKSGVVQIGVDQNDQVLKGLSASIDSITSGYTNQQTLNAERQRIAYEDSKINHLLNSVGVVVGQLLSSDETTPQWLLDYMKTGMSKLLTPNLTTGDAFDGIPPVTP